MTTAISSHRRWSALKRLTDGSFRWEYLNSPKPGLYNTVARQLVEMLKVVVQIVDYAEHGNGSEAWAKVETLTATSSMHRRVVEAMVAGDRTQDIGGDAIATCLSTLKPTSI